MPRRCGKLSAGLKSPDLILSDTTETQSSMNFTLKQIGTIHTPYTDSAPYQPVDAGDDVFCVELYDGYSEGLQDLSMFSYIYLLYFAHRAAAKADLIVTPPWAGGKEVGVFASRSPVRPNPIGLSVVQVKSVTENRVYTSGLDVFDGTPLLDIKPYLKDLDTYYWFVKAVDNIGRESLFLKSSGTYLDTSLRYHCNNSVWDPDLGETDVDCGGECSGCDINMNCSTNNDCKSGLGCINNTCQQKIAEHCINNVTDDYENIPGVLLCPALKQDPINQARLFISRMMQIVMKFTFFIQGEWCLFQLM